MHDKVVVTTFSYRSETALGTNALKTKLSEVRGTKYNTAIDTCKESHIFTARNFLRCNKCMYNIQAPTFTSDTENQKLLKQSVK